LLWKFKCCKCDFCKRKVGDSSAFGVVKITINFLKNLRAHGNLQKTKAKQEKFTKGVSRER
jgi:hypothetical protein